MIRARKSRGGLLLELLLGMAIVVIAVLGLFALFPSADKAVADSDHRTQALNIARSVMESTLAKSYDSLPAGITSGSTSNDHTLRRGAQPTEEYLYSVSTTVPDASKEVKRILVTVSWTRQDRTSEVTLESSKGRMW